MKKNVIVFMIAVMSIFSVTVMAEQDIQLNGPDSAETIVVHSMDENQALISVLDAAENPITGLKEKDFSMSQGRRNGRILSVSPLETVEEAPIYIVLVADNSLSMKHRHAVKPLLNAMEKFYGAIRPIDYVNAIVFDDDKTISVKGRAVHARSFESNNPAELRSFFQKSFSEGLTKKTYLYDSMMAGLDMISRMPNGSHKILLVFTDGEDVSSKVKTSELFDMAKGITNFSFYALDFMEDRFMDSFLHLFSDAYNGRIWKAESAAQIVPIFESFSRALRQHYVIDYKILNPPSGTVAFEQGTVMVEEVNTVESSPFLNYVFFEEGLSTIPDEYILYSDERLARDFSEDELGGTMEKYRNILNILGKRLMDNPDAQITITGCNSDQGPEKDNMNLSQSRSEAVQAYLQNIWGIEPSRIEVIARNLPENPSARTTRAGIAENSRVEIRSSDTSILDMVTSTYVQNMADELRIKPRIRSEAGIADWKVVLKGDNETVIDSASGKGDIGSVVTFNLIPAGLGKIASLKNLTASIEVTDKEGLAFKNESAAIANVQLVRKKVPTAERDGQRRLETYSLILFEYDKADIREHNKAVIDRIVARIREIPDAKVWIVGHTDSIGPENYNLRLSRGRARAVYNQITAGLTELKNLTYKGVGLHQPLYDNASPEGRALNRTVVVTLDYEDKS